VTGTVARVLRCLRSVWSGLPGCDRAERGARAAIGMPARHPERITGDLPGGQEEWLAGLAAALWPDGEHAAIIAGTRPQDRP
jgi:hypothetical protein